MEHPKSTRNRIKRSHIDTGGTKGNREDIPPWVIIVLPAVSALLSTLLLQFRVRDMWQLRDEGRIATELLICKAHLIPTETREIALKSAMELRIAAIELERDQSRRFFSVIGQPSSKDAVDPKLPVNAVQKS